MVEDVYLNSLDEDVREFTPDEVFDTVENARDAVKRLIECYNGSAGPFVYPVLLRDRTNIGYVQAVGLENGKWEIGYHIAKVHTGNGYATEAVTWRTSVGSIILIKNRCVRIYLEISHNCDIIRVYNQNIERKELV